MVRQDKAGTFAVQMSTDTRGGMPLECEMQVRTCFLHLFSSLLAKESRAFSVLSCAPHDAGREEESQWEQGVPSSNPVPG